MLKKYILGMIVFMGILIILNIFEIILLWGKTTPMAFIAIFIYSILSIFNVMFSFY